MVHGFTDPQHALLAAFGLLDARRLFLGTLYLPQFDQLLARSIDELCRHGRFQEWHHLVSNIAVPDERVVRLAEDCPTVTAKATPESLRTLLHLLGPWKKGPLSLFGIEIDAEWRSDLKWRRVRELVTPLTGRRVLDVGTGNGYFLLRAVGDGASFVLGLEPSVAYCCQYLAISRCFSQSSMALLPAGAEQFVEGCGLFDTVFSMGVLYHRRSPLDHLAHLKSFLRPGGELVLETLVVPGGEGYCLLPKDRYANMRNVWLLPSLATLCCWLERLGFVEIRSGPLVRTTPEEQRVSPWSGPVSLSRALDPVDPTRTIEGYPAPTRVLVAAQRPTRARPAR